MWQAVVELGFSERTQQAIAELFGVSQSVVSAWKAGKGGVDLETALRAQREHGVRGAYVIFGDGTLRIGASDEQQQRDIWQAGRASAFREIADYAGKAAISPGALSVEQVIETVEEVQTQKKKGRAKGAQPQRKVR